MGVDLFFVISGFLITGILLQQKEAVTDRLLVLRNFIVKRVLRLFPAYYLLLVLLTAAQALFGLWSWNAGEAIWYYAYASNILTFLHGFRGAQVNHLWTLAVEEQFYLVWPWLVLFLSRRSLLRCMLVLAALSFIFKTGWHALPHVRVFTFSNFDTLCGGALIAILGTEARWFQWALRNQSALVLAAIAGLIIHKAFSPSALLLNAAVWVLSMMLVLQCIPDHGGAWGRLLKQPWMVHTGRISYGLYLYHKPILAAMLLMQEKWGGPMHPWLLLVATLVITYAVAEASFRWLERPFLRLKERFDL